MIDYSLWTTLSILEESSLFLCIREFDGNKAYTNTLIQRNKELSSNQLLSLICLNLRNRYLSTCLSIIISVNFCIFVLFHTCMCIFFISCIFYYFVRNFKLSIFILFSYFCIPNGKPKINFENGRHRGTYRNVRLKTMNPRHVTSFWISLIILKT